ncbi:MAG: DUF2076 domain-containing protein [Roseiarcus sp.]
MTPEERQMLADLFERIRSTSTGARDPQAEAFINDAVRGIPQTPYVLAQTVLVQQHALEAATQRISELEAQDKAAPQPETSFLGGLGRSLFGAPPPPPQPQQRPGAAYDASAYQRGANAPPPPQYAPQQPYAPPPQPGPWGAAPSTGGFLSSALRTATGVAGGMVLANAVESLFSGRSGGLFGGHGVVDPGFAAPREVVNNYYSDSPDPGAMNAQDVAQGDDDVRRSQDQNYAQDAADNGGWDNSSSMGSDDSFDT